MNRVVVAALVVLVILVGVPLVGAMPMMADCPQCHLPSGAAVGMCLAILALFSLVSPEVFGRLTRRHSIMRQLLVAATLERPPRAS
ncbi:MAG: hypothetical protein ACRDH1_04015 [Actinomycetota bacterium]